MRNIIVALALAAGAASAEEARDARGEAFYRERIALPEGAMLIVETRDEAGALFSETRVTTGGRQVPFSFVLPAPAGAGALRAAIAYGAETRWLSDPVPLAAEGPLDLGMVILRPHVSMSFVSRMRCGEETVLVGVNGADVVIEARGKRHRLPPAPAASGARYEKAGEPGTFFWSRGEGALVSLAGEALQECALAPLPGPDFRAAGNEPGWSFTVKGAEAMLELDYGAERRVAPLPPPGIDGDGATVIASAALGAVIRIAERLCHDDATGMPHPFAVSVEADGRALTGCGGRPLDLLLGGEWIVESLGGETLEAEGRPTMTFAEEGRIFGFSGCNRYFAGFALTGETFSVSGAGMTMMACAEAAMARERVFTAALEETARFDVESGALTLIDGSGETLLRARR